MVESPDWRDREMAALRERLSRLSQASLRINESLDFDTVLQGALDSARSLTSARYGVMTLLDGGGGVQEFLTSGLTSGEAERLLLTPDRWRLFAALTNIDEPLRLPDLTAHVHALGFTDFTIPLPVEVFRFMAAPLFHRGVRVGHVFVGDREGGGEFTDEDQETLVMFAAQAALVIANAGAHREVDVGHLPTGAAGDHGMLRRAAGVGWPLNSVIGRQAPEFLHWALTGG